LTPTTTTKSWTLNLTATWSRCSSPLKPPAKARPRFPTSFRMNENMDVNLTNINWS
jgi:hypothetical protein